MHLVRTEGTVLGLRERKKRATRRALAEAAVRLAAEHGAENVTVEAISEAAGVSPRTFFNYFDTHDDAFVMIDRDVGERVRRAVREASAGRPPLEVVREAFAAELMNVEEQQEIWRLRATVLQRSPHLLIRGMGAHIADEIALAEAIAGRDGATTPAVSPTGRRRQPPCAERPAPGPFPDTSHLDLYPKLLASVANTAVRVSAEHWCAQAQAETPSPAAFLEIFHDVFDQLAAGLPQPQPGDRPSKDSRRTP
ncbi:TetR family transcriptional regulator [Streptomyces sp. NPDC001780]|uniref:TetR family transcriptional regulator n=1 Tax=Streptomyces hebeiensis TaxID=229486 RepID=UPI0031E3F7F5